MLEKSHRVWAFSEVKWMKRETFGREDLNVKKLRKHWNNHDFRRGSWKTFVSLTSMVKVGGEGGSNLVTELNYPIRLDLAPRNYLS